jgi:membrane associated rhomboid family serine protease
MNDEWPYVTFILITINLAVFLFTYEASVNQVSEWALNTFGLIPQQLHLRLYTLITHMFIHGDIVHFYGNMFMLAIVGWVGERKIGGTKFALFYFLSGLIVIPFAFLMEYLTNVTVILIGASGAIFGLMFLAGALAGWEEVPALLIPVLNLIALPYVAFTLKNIKLPLFVAILFYFIENLMMLFINLPYSIGEVAHFAGVIGGVIAFTIVLPGEDK